MATASNRAGVYEVFAAKSGSMEGLGPVLHDDCVKLSLVKIPLLAHPGYDLNGRKLKTNPVVALECVLEDWPRVIAVFNRRKKM